jgi:hypothetical protein
MSLSVSLQDLILAKLQADTLVTSIVADRIVDGPDETIAFPYISFGPMDFVPDDADCIYGREETIQLDCWSRDQGRKWPCKELADAVKAALHDTDGELTAGALVQMRVTLIRVFDDPDGLTTHGVVQVTATTEE